MIINQNKEKVSTNLINFSNYKMNATPEAFQLLSQNLYKNPKKAILRELLCNALDAEKILNPNATIEDVEIYLPNLNSPEIKIVDHGVGMTKEEVVELYTTYFGSNKNDTNDLTGGFGLGSKTPFSIVDKFFVITRKNGIELNVLCFKNSAGFPQLTILEEKPSAEIGTEVSFIVSESDYIPFYEVFISILLGFCGLPKIKNGVEQFFDYFFDCSEKNDFYKSLEDNSSYKEYQEQLIKVSSLFKETLKDLKNVPLLSKFSLTNKEIKEFGTEEGFIKNIIKKKLLKSTFQQSFFYCRIGGVIYPLEDHFYFYQMKEVYATIQNVFVVIDVPIGKVSIAPSREELSYSTDTIEYLVSIIPSTIETLFEYIKKEIHPEILKINTWKSINLFTQLFQDDKNQNEKKFEYFNNQRVEEVFKKEFYKKYLTPKEKDLYVSFLERSKIFKTLSEEEKVVIETKIKKILEKKKVESFDDFTELQLKQLNFSNANFCAISYITNKLVDKEERSLLKFFEEDLFLSTYPTLNENILLGQLPINNKYNVAKFLVDEKDWETLTSNKKRIQAKRIIGRVEKVFNSPEIVLNYFERLLKDSFGIDIKITKHYFRPQSILIFRKEKLKQYDENFLKSVGLSTFIDFSEIKVEKKEKATEVEVKKEKRVVEEIKKIKWFNNAEKAFKKDLPLSMPSLIELTNEAKKQNKKIIYLISGSPGCNKEKTKKMNNGIENYVKIESYIEETFAMLRKKEKENFKDIFCFIKIGQKAYSFIENNPVFISLYNFYEYYLTNFSDFSKEQYLLNTLKDYTDDFNNFNKNIKEQYIQNAEELSDFFELIDFQRKIETNTLFQTRASLEVFYNNLKRIHSDFPLKCKINYNYVKDEVKIIVDKIETFDKKYPLFLPLTFHSSYSKERNREEFKEIFQLENKNEEKQEKKYLPLEYMKQITKLSSLLGDDLYKEDKKE